MTTSSRLLGKVVPVFTLKGGDIAIATSFADDLKSFELSPEAKSDSDLTFAEAAQGAGNDWTLKVSTVVSFDAGSLFAACWDNAGLDLEVVIGPWGNAAPSATQPHFKFTAAAAMPGLKNEARTSPEGAAVDIEFKGSTPVVKITAAA